MKLDVDYRASLLKIHSQTKFGRSVSSSRTLGGQECSQPMASSSRSWVMVGAGATSRSTGEPRSVGLPLGAQKKNVSSGRSLDKQDCSWPITMVLEPSYRAVSVSAVGPRPESLWS